MTAAVVAAALSAAWLYAAAARTLRGRGDRWPVRRDALFCLGAAGLCAAVAQPWPGGPFTVHMAGHLVTGMVAPLLIACARPVTLALRALPTPPRRALKSCVRTRLARAATWPPLAAVLDVGGLWLLYRTPLFAAAHHRPWLDALVHVHVFAAGLLFSVSVLALDPVHGAGRRVCLRAATLVLASAAHNILAKSLYAHGVSGETVFAAHDVRAGSLLMYYGGDAVEIALALVVGLQWLRATGRAHARLTAPPPTTGTPVGTPGTR
ncbi:cytochrome c oxidase assembly protein [Streptomyces sp. BYX5S]